MDILAKRLKELRKDKKISLERLANIIGVSDTAVLKWEQNKSEPTAVNLKQLATYFEVSADYLIGLEDETGAKTYSAKYNINAVTHSGNGDIKFS